MPPAVIRWVGIDEAGYGPNLGPLVMTAVVAESAEDRPPDLWADLAETVSGQKGPADVFGSTTPRQSSRRVREEIAWTPPRWPP